MRALRALRAPCLGSLFGDHPSLGLLSSFGEKPRTFKSNSDSNPLIGYGKTYSTTV